MKTQVNDPTFNIQKSFILPYFDTTRFMILVGGRRSGKSFFAMQKCLSRLYDEQDTRILVVMEVGSSLDKKAWSMAKEVISVNNLQDFFSYNETLKKITCLKNNNEMWFIGLNDPDKARGLTSVTSILIDEADQLTLKDFQMLITSISTKHDYEGYIQTILTLNGISKSNWVYKNFVQKKEFNPASVYYFSTVDNKHLSDEAVNNIMAGLKTENDKNVFFYGKWGEVTDRIVFSNWKCDKANPISTNFADYKYVYAGIDWGKNTSVIEYIGQKDEPDDIYIFKEIFTRDTVTSDFIKLLNNSNLPKDVLMIADEADPNSITEMKRLGFRIRKTEKAKDPKMSAINWLQGKNIYIHPSCKLLLEEIESYSYLWDEKNNMINDKEVQPFDDHSIDATRYGTSQFRRMKFIKVI